MPVPRHSTGLPSVQLAEKDTCYGVTELRVHGVGGTPPDATLGDLAPEQVMGDAVAGFYRTGDHLAGGADYPARRDVDRHVEVYSWGGLTSRSKVRVLWLVLLPFLLGNLAGWMCPAGTRKSPGKFRLHRLAAGLGALALTVNAALIALMISADVAAYQTTRAGITRHQWWLAPLNWKFVAGYPARQITVGVLAVLLFVLALVWLAARTWRYEAVRPPYKVDVKRKEKARWIAAATLPKGLADDEFWDGERSVRLLTWLHVAVVGGFGAITLGVTAKALAPSPRAVALAWLAIGLGAAIVAAGAGYVAWDALTTKAASAADGTAADSGPRGWPRFLPVPAAVAVLAAGLFAWLQPAAKPGPEAGLPGMSSVIGWTALAIGVVLAIALVSMLAGLPGSGRTLKGGPWLTLMLGFGTLNILMLGAEFWLAHLLGPVASDAAAASAHHQIYLPYLITSGVPLVVWATVGAVAVFGAAEAWQWWRTRTLGKDCADEYADQVKGFRDPLAPPRKYWYWSGLRPFSPLGDKDPDPGASKGWEKEIARKQFLATVPNDAAWLLWLIVGGQLVMALCVWRLHVQPPVLIRNLGIGIAGLALPVLMGFLAAAWNDPVKRRTIGILWDVGTFWPRSYHPLSPPCYTERAIPELQRRMWWLHDSGGHVMLTGHSQGSVLAVASLVQPGCRPESDAPALITFGSPVGKLYGWAFPAYFDAALLKRIVPGGPGHVNTWRNFYYPTDPIGGPVAGGLDDDVREQVDVPYLDPERCYYVYGQAPPAAQGHSGYWADSRVWEVINRVAAALPAGLPPSDETAQPAGAGTAAAEAVQELVRDKEPTAGELAKLADAAVRRRWRPRWIGRRGHHPRSPVKS